MYTDETFLMEGKHKFTTLKNVPAKYLINISKSTRDKFLKEYVERNKEILLKKIDAEKKIISNTKCKKISYLTEKEALTEIIRIMHKKQENVKPIRVYKCFCGAYHLTSKNYIDFDEKK